MAVHELYLIRHAVAAERGEEWPDDSKRPLTDDGIAKMRLAARGLVRLDVTFDVVLTSPYIRTRQTAEIVAASFDQRPPIAAIESLTPNGSFQGLLADLDRQSRRGRMALVGHEPDLGQIAARLAGLRQPLEFRKGAVCRIDVKTIPPAGAGALRWFMTAKMLGLIKKSS